MQETLNVGQTVSVLGTAVEANGNPSPAVLSATSYTSSDPTVFTVGPDPTNPLGDIITGVAAGSATLTETATATEPDGKTTEQVQGTATIIVNAVVPPAAGIVFTFGTPQ